MAEVVHQYAEAVAGHWAIPVPAQPQFPRGSASQVADGARGQLVAFLEEVPLKANPDQAFIDLGSDA